MKRPSMDEVWLRVALDLSARGTCYKARVGCVLTNARGHVLSTGWNGPEEGAPHCNEVVYEPSLQEMVGGPPVPPRYPHACPGAFAPRGSDLCEAVHAEQNALSRCAFVDQIRTAYCSLSPCLRCAKQLLNTGMQRLVYARLYEAEPQALALLSRPSSRRPSGVELIHLPEE